MDGIDLSELSPLEREALRARMQELGYDTLEQYFGALMQDALADPQMHKEVMALGGVPEELSESMRQRARQFLERHRPAEDGTDFSI